MPSLQPSATTITSKSTPSLQRAQLAFEEGAPVVGRHDDGDGWGGSGHVLAAAALCEAQEVRQHGRAALREDALRVELHPQTGCVAWRTPMSTRSPLPGSVVQALGTSSSGGSTTTSEW